MARDTKQVEKLLAGTRANLKALKLEIAAGAGGLDSIQNDLLNHEQIFVRRLNELKNLNRRETTQPELGGGGQAPNLKS